MGFNIRLFSKTFHNKGGIYFANKNNYVVNILASCSNFLSVAIYFPHGFPFGEVPSFIEIWVFTFEQWCFQLSVCFDVILESQLLTITMVV